MPDVTKQQDRVEPEANFTEELDDEALDRPSHANAWCQGGCASVRPSTGGTP